MFLQNIRKKKYGKHLFKKRAGLRELVPSGHIERTHFRTAQLRKREFLLNCHSTCTGKLRNLLVGLQPVSLKSP